MAKWGEDLHDNVAEWDLKWYHIPVLKRVYPPVKKHRPWQIGVGRLVSTKNGLFSWSMLIYQRVVSGG